MIRASFPRRSSPSSESRWRRRSLEELVDQLFAAMGFKDPETETAEAAETGAVRSIHEARRLRQAGDVDGALVPTGDGGTLEVAAVLGMRWRPGKVVSGRSLRGLRPLTGGA